MKILVDDVKLQLLLEKKKRYIGKKVAWDNILSASSFTLSVVLASYKTLFGIPGITFKIIFMIIGIGFTIKAIVDMINSVKHSYTYEDLLEDINTLNEITHNHSIVVIRDTFEKYSNRYLLYDDSRWKCKLFINYKDTINNESFIKDHLSRELKLDIAKIKISYISQKISEKISGSDGEKKVYLHKLFLAEITEFPSHMKNDTFECDHKIYHWNSIIDLENDAAAMEKNSDIISFVKENI